MAEFFLIFAPGPALADHLLIQVGNYNLLSAHRLCHGMVYVLGATLRSPDKTARASLPFPPTPRLPADLPKAWALRVWIAP